MLALTRPHRQVLATLAVVVLLIAPTCYVGWFVWRVNQPGHVRDVERSLSRELGLRVSLEGVRYPRPGEVEFRGMVVHSEVPGGGDARLTQIARAEVVLLRREGQALSFSTDGLRLSASSPRQGAALMTSLFQRSGLSGVSQVMLMARTCELELGSGLGYTLRDLAGTFREDSQAPTVTASYRVVEKDKATRCELSIGRDRRGEAIHTTIALRTADEGDLPVRVLDPFINAAGWVGDSARVTGELTLGQSGSGDWEATFSGGIRELDLGSLMSRVAPEHRLDGRGELVVEHARWAYQPGRGPGWVDVTGSLGSRGGGTISWTLLEALGSQLGFRLSERLDGTRPLLEYGALGFKFQITQDGRIALEGGLGPESQAGAVLVPGQGQRQGAMAYAPEGEATVPGLIRALVSRSEDAPDQLIPARLESLLIQRHLPAPEVHVDEAIKPVRVN